MPDPAGGARASLSGMVALLTRPFRGGKAPTNTQDDLTQFKETFQPDTGNFSPGFPLVPPQREPLRAWNYPFSWNTIYTPRAYENISFAELRALAENYDICRLCIETRKDQIEKHNWNIVPKDEDDHASDAHDRAAKMQEFFSHPDGYQPFASWLRELLEDLLVLDAPCLEIRRNRANEIIGLDIIDGSTINVLLDYNGRVPRPPAPAFEQIIHGRPWSLIQDGQRTNDEKASDPIRFTDSELIYMPRNRRPHKAYGFSPVEQIIITVNIGLRRQISQLNEFTDGNMPPGMITAPAGWNPDHIQQFQDWFDSILSGNLANKRKLMWGPDGARYQRFFEAPIKDEFDEWLARIVCYAFSLPVVPFTKTQNRGEQESVKESSQAEGESPLKGWIQRLCNNVIQRRMGHEDLEFVWADEESVDPLEQAKIVDLKQHSGRLTLNEARDQEGMDPVDGGDHIMFMTPSGPLLLSAIVGGTGLPRDLIGTVDDPAEREGPPDPADAETTADEQPGATADLGQPGASPPKPGRPGDAANPRTDPNAGDVGGPAKKPKPKTKVGADVVNRWVDRFRKAGAAPKRTRDSFLYLTPAPGGPSGDFAQCSSCVMWVPGNDLCTIHGSDVKIEGGDSCGLYVPGEPQPAGALTRKLVTPLQSGLVSRQVRCENCSAYDAAAGECALFYELNEVAGDLFDLDTSVEARGCCNAQMPIEEAPGAKAALPFSRRARLGTAPGRNTALLTRTETKLKERLHSFFAERATHVAAQVAKELKSEN